MLGVLGILLTVLIVLIPVLIIAVIVSAVGKKNNDKEILSFNGGNITDAPESCFDGRTIQYIGWRILTNIINTITFGIAYPWTMCMMYRWETKHTVINGRRLKFTGKGVQLIGKFLLWYFLTIITFGIYGIWLGVNMEKWKAKHTVYADDESKTPGKFTGGAGGWFLNHILFGLMCLIPIVGFAFAQVRLLKWKTRNTVIGGSRLIFKGNGFSLFGKYFVYGLLTMITFGIFALFVPVRLLRWEVSNKVALYKTSYIRKKSNAHQEEAIKDFAKYRIAANDTELAVIKSGINGNETKEKLEELAAAGNPYAKYHLAVMQKESSENNSFDEVSVGYINDAAAAGYHLALFEKAVNAKESAEYPALLEESAKNGNLSAPWHLKQYYEKAAPEAYKKDKNQGRELIKKCGYWFKIAIEQGHSEACADKAAYDVLVEKIALWECGADAEVGTGIAVKGNDNASVSYDNEKSESKPLSKGAKIAIISVAVAVLALVIGLVVNTIMFVSSVDHADKTYGGSILRTVWSGSDEKVVFVKKTDAANINKGDKIVYIRYNVPDDYEMYRVTVGFVKDIVEKEDGTFEFSVKTEYLDYSLDNDAPKSVAGILRFIPIVNIFVPRAAMKEPAMLDSETDVMVNDSEQEEAKEEAYDTVSQEYVLGVYEKDAGAFRNWLANGPFDKDYDEYYEAVKVWIDYRETKCFYGDDVDFTVSAGEIKTLGDEESVVEYIEFENESSFSAVDEDENLNINGGFSKYYYSNSENYYNGEFNVIHPEYLSAKFSLDASSGESVYLATTYGSYSYDSITNKSCFEFLTGAIKPGESLERIPLTKSVSERLTSIQRDGYSKEEEVNIYVIVLRSDDDGNCSFGIAGKVSLKIRVFKVTELEILTSSWGTAYREGNSIFYKLYYFAPDGFSYHIYEYTNDKYEPVPDSINGEVFEGWYVSYDNIVFYDGTPEYEKDSEDYVKSVTLGYELAMDANDPDDVLWTDEFVFEEICDEYIIMTDKDGKSVKYYDCFALDAGYDNEEIFKFFNIDYSV